MSEQLSVGIDIGSTKVAGVVGQWHDSVKKMEVLASAIREDNDSVDRGVILNIDSAAEKVKEVLEDLKSQLRDQGVLDIKLINVGVAGSEIKCITNQDYSYRTNPGETIKVEEIDKLKGNMFSYAGLSGYQIVEVLPKEFMIDDSFSLKDPVGAVGQKIEGNFNILAAQIVAMNNLNRTVRRADVAHKPIIQPIASAISTLSEEEMESGVILVDIGGGTTDVIIFHDKMLKTASVIPIGGKVLTNDIKTGCSLREKEAEFLKVRYGCAISDQIKIDEYVTFTDTRQRTVKEIRLHSLAKIIETRMVDICEFVTSIINSSDMRNKLGAGLVLTGGGSQMPFLKELFELMTGLEVKIGYPNVHLYHATNDQVKSPQFSTAVGLALSQFQSIDFREARYNRLRADNSRFSITPQKDKSSSEESKKEKSNSILGWIKGMISNDLDSKSEY